MSSPSRIERTVARILAAPLLIAALAGAAPPGRSIGGVARPPVATILIGESWVGLFRGGRIVRRVATPGWRINAARLSANGATLAIVAYPDPPSTAREDPATVLRLDARTLARIGRSIDPRAGDWQPLPAPIGIDPPNLPPSSVRLGKGETVIAVAPGSMLTANPDGRNGADMRLRSADGTVAGARHRVPAGDLRAALSPDGSTAAAFVAPPGNPGRWSGQAWDTVSARPIAAHGLTIDDGRARDSGAPRALACLLPHGAGAIFTYLGAPADRRSEFQPFGATATPVALDAPYVMTCLATTASLRRPAAPRARR